MTKKATTRRRSERGAALLLGAFMFAFLALPLCALGVDTSRWWVEAQRLQAAADAASTAGVTYMPDDFAAAKARAIQVATINGYTNGIKGTTVTVVAGNRPTRLKVTISREVGNLFAKSFGVDTTKVTRGAMADYNGPAAMGSPCNTMGNEPAGGAPLSGPVASVLPGTIPSPAICSSNPQFWANIGGPDWPKGNGDQFMTRNCGVTGVSGCTGTKNDEFDPLGYFYVVRVGPTAVNKSVRIQLYDPAFVSQGDYCESGPTGAAVNAATWNNYTTNTTAGQTAIERYKQQASGATNAFCTGDVATTAVPTNTSFGLRGVTASKDPRIAPPISTSTCIKQYPGYAAASLTRDTLRSSAPAATYNDKLSKVFHQWVTMCDFTPTEAGDYYIQVRTNVALGGSLGTDGIYTGNTTVLTQTTDNTSVGGGGANRFAIRAYAPTGGITAGDLSVSSQERMPIYANATGANSEFNLVRVIPSAAGKTLVFGFFDVGEAATGGTMQVIPPTDATNISNPIAGCTGNGVVTGALTACKITGIQSSGWNGKQQFIRVPIPNTYTCNTASQGGCWFRVAVNFGAGNVVNDSTTWTAKIEGEPIRLVE